MYLQLVRSFLDYGTIVCGSGASSKLKKLDQVQYQCLRLCTGAFKSTLVAALLLQMGEQPQEKRREKLTMNYWVNLEGHSRNHPAQVTLKPCWEKEKRRTMSFEWTVTEKAKHQID